jgi:hypothetical protein
MMMMMMMMMITFTFKPEKLAHEVIINTWSRAAPIVKKFIAFCGK